MRPDQQLRVLVLAVAVCAAGFVFLGGTGAVSSIEADRSLTGEVVADTQAYYGIEIAANETNGTTEPEITVINRVPGEVTITTVEIRDGSGSVLEVASPKVRPGNAVSIQVESLDCGDPVEVYIEASAGAVAADRTINCA